MLIKTLAVGQYETNCYIVTNENTLQCVVIDPGDEANAILDYLEDNKLKAQAVLITHGHFDHVGAANYICEELNIPVYISKKDDASLSSDPMEKMFGYAMPEYGKHYDEGDELELAGMSFKILATPGHTPGGVSIICQDAIFCGDTLFKGSCGRTDMPGGDMDQELRSIKKLCMLSGDYEVYPGHMDSTTLERERTFNYYCRLAMEKY